MMAKKSSYKVSNFRIQHYAEFFTGFHRWDQLIESYCNQGRAQKSTFLLLEQSYREL